MAGNTINVHGNYIDIHDNNEVNINIDKASVTVADGRGTTTGESCRAENADEASCPEENPAVEEPLNFFGPTNALQQLLRQSWLAEVRTDNRYDEIWSDALVEALMASEYGEQIAREWSEKEDCRRSRHNIIKAQLIGTLADAGVLRGSYGALARHVGIVVNENNKDPKNNYKTFADYMGHYKGRKPPYADWVRKYVQDR